MQPAVTILSPSGEESIHSRTSARPNLERRRLIQSRSSLNGQTIGTANNATFRARSLQDLVAGGRHTLTIVAVDDIGNRGEGSVAINYLTTAPSTLPPPTDTGITTVDALLNTSGTAF